MRKAVVVALTLVLAACGSEPEVVVAPVTEVPQGCLDALDAAQETFEVFGDYSQIALGYVNLISKAQRAGELYSVALTNEVTREMNKLTLRTDAITERVSTIIDDFTVDAAECREVAG